MPVLLPPSVLWAAAITSALCVILLIVRAERKLTHF